MNIKITMTYDLNSDKPDPNEQIKELVRQSYDYQHAAMDYDTINRSGSIRYNFYFYLDHCNQPKRTLETLRKIEDLIMSYI